MANELHSETLTTAISPPIYRELDVTCKEIRILNLQPGPQHEDIHGHFEYTYLSEPNVTYETISYAWGDPFERGSMYLSNHLLDIPRSAETVLRRVRLAEKPRLLWIDSVCINQNMQRERETQVALMSEIYGNGKLNLIWLGPASEKTLAAIQSISSLAEEFVDATYNLTDNSFFADGTLSLSGIQSRVDSLATIEYYESPWFKRVWVLQEACLSPRSICLRGDFETPLIDIIRAACVLSKASYFLPEVWHRAPQTHAYTMATFVDDVAPMSISRPDVALYALLVLLHTFECSDQRDRVYGITGLYQKYSRKVEVPQALAPDYSASTERVWENAARQAITDKNDLALLRFVSPSDENTQLASWVPAFSVARTDWTPLSIFFNADDQEPMEIHDVGSQTNQLSVSGFFVDRVQDVIPAFYQTPELHRTASELLDGFSDIEKLAISSQESEADDIARLATMIQAGADHYGRVADYQRSASAYTRVKQYLATYDSLPDPTAPVEEDEREIIDFMFSVRLCSRRRSVFRTKTGYLGLGVQKMRAGDIIAILYGCKYPVILRPLSEPDCQYRFVGVSFVEGIMAGSLTGDHKASGRPDVVFHLQ